MSVENMASVSNIDGIPSVTIIITPPRPSTQEAVLAKVQEELRRSDFDDALKRSGMVKNLVTGSMPVDEVNRAAFMRELSKYFNGDKETLLRPLNLRIDAMLQEIAGLKGEKTTLQHMAEIRDEHIKAMEREIRHLKLNGHNWELQARKLMPTSSDNTKAITKLDAGITILTNSENAELEKAIKEVKELKAKLKEAAEVEKKYRELQRNYECAKKEIMVVAENPARCRYILKKYGKQPSTLTSSTKAGDYGTARMGPAKNSMQAKRGPSFDDIGIQSITADEAIDADIKEPHHATPAMVGGWTGAIGNFNLKSWSPWKKPKVDKGKGVDRSAQGQRSDGMDDGLLHNGVARESVANVSIASAEMNWSPWKKPKVDKGKGVDRSAQGQRLDGMDDGLLQNEVARESVSNVSIATAEIAGGSGVNVNADTGYEAYRGRSDHIENTV